MSAIPKEKGDIEESTPLLQKEKEAEKAKEDEPNRVKSAAAKAKEKADALAQKGKKFFVSAGQNLGKKFDLPEPESVMEYQTRDLASWSTYTYFTGTILQNKLQWWVVIKLFGMSFAVYALCFIIKLNPRHILSLQLEQMNKILNFFVGIMLAFFMGSSVKRWVDTVGGFLSLFDAIRNLNMQFLALGVDPHRIEQVKRYGMLSCEFLIIELHMRNKLPEERQEEIAKMWGDESGDELGLEEWEQKIIKEVFTEENRVSSQLWTWVATLLGRMAQDGDIPPMASPTYGRIMNLAQDAQEGIRQVRISMTVQMPFIYVHTLAMLVHMNNICAAVSFGAHLAIHVSAIMYFFGVRWENVMRLSKEAQGGSAEASFEEIVMHMITALFPAFMYMGFLQIGLTLAQPFDEAFGAGLSAIPTRRLIKNLEGDLDAATKMNAAVGGWERPSFKQSTAPKPAAPPAPATAAK